MTEIRKADPRARRLGVVLLLATLALGTVVFLTVDRFTGRLREWLLSDPAAADRRLQLVFAAFALAASAPLLAFAVYLWRLGREVIQARMFPPPDRPVAADTPIVEGHSAVKRGRALQTSAVVLTACCVLFWLVLWRLSAFIRPAG